jgi:hypothetical protein
MTLYARIAPRARAVTTAHRALSRMEEKRDYAGNGCEHSKKLPTPMFANELDNNLWA